MKGYSIGNDSQISSQTMIRYVTVGWLLEKLLHSHSFYLQLTHIILDEIHERSLDHDLLSLLIKKLRESAQNKGNKKH